MSAPRKQRPDRGFSLVELLTALAIFLVICGVAFELLTMAMKRYQSESQVLNVFQEARFGLDQMVRDINDSGYPPLNEYTSPPSNSTIYALSPIAWSPNYSTSTCAIGSTCTTPSGYDVILETKANSTSSSPTVQWIRYQLSGTTLYRASVDKDGGTDPVGSTSGQLVPYVQNVVNNVSAAQIAQFQLDYPDMFPSGPVAIFTYLCDSPTGPQDCTNPGVDNSPENVRAVGITLIVMSPFPDAQTGRPKLVELKGLARRINNTD
ncbi:MAG TPA: type II secretion system protein [Candidatus Acidoferrum sp.]|nr:type II secretion system protein [Candidatus Acidoferrum sp.]